MLTTNHERRICKEYGEMDSNGFVLCKDCPLRKGHGEYDFRCKANSHYNRKTKEWEYDEESEEGVSK